MDVCGPLNLTPRKNKYLLTFIDNFFKYAKDVPIPDMAVETCARAYATQVIARPGSGSFVITKQAHNCTSAFFKETCKILGVKHLNISGYHPQANGTVKRFHKTMNQGLSRYVDVSGTYWDNLVPFYLMAYRAAPYGTSGFNPYYLLHG
jgi:transposase InsO family protein